MPWAQQLADAEARLRASESVSGLFEVSVSRLVVARMFGCLASGRRLGSSARCRPAYQGPGGLGFGMSAWRRKQRGVSVVLHRVMV